MTQKNQIITALKRGDKITGLIAWQEYHINRLRNDGHDISTRMMDSPDGGQYAEYRIV